MAVQRLEQPVVEVQSGLREVARMLGLRVDADARRRRQSRGARLRGALRIGRRHEVEHFIEGRNRNTPS